MDDGHDRLMRSYEEWRRYDEWRPAIKAVKAWRRTGLAVKSGAPDPEGADAHLQATLALIAEADDLLAAEKGE
jgi:hypothetical protein